MDYCQRMGSDVTSLADVELRERGAAVANCHIIQVKPNPIQILGPALRAVHREQALVQAVEAAQDHILGLVDEEDRLRPIGLDRVRP